MFRKKEKLLKNLDLGYFREQVEGGSAITFKKGGWRGVCWKGEWGGVGKADRGGCRKGGWGEFRKGGWGSIGNADGGGEYTCFG